MNGDVRYTGGTMNLPAFTEFFAGTDRGTREFLTTGYANAKRINVSADFGIIWQISQKFSLSDQYDFLDFREPALANLNTVNYPGASMLLPPGPAQPPVPTFAPTFLGMKTETNTATATWEPFSRASVSLGYRYQQRFINWVMPLATEALPDGASYTVPIFENAGILGFELQPTRQWKVNAKFEASYYGRAYTQISPRQLYRCHVQSRYKPREWATITATFQDLERRDNVTLVNHLDHIRSFSVGATLMPKRAMGWTLTTAMATSSRRPRYATPQRRLPRGPVRALRRRAAAPTTISAAATTTLPPNMDHSVSALCPPRQCAPPSVTGSAPSTAPLSF